MTLDLGGQFQAYTDQRLDTEAFALFENNTQLGGSLDHKETFQAQLSSVQAKLDKFCIFVPITNDTGLTILQMRHGDNQFRLAARLKAVMILTAKLGNLFHHMALLIDLDRKDTAVLALVIHLADGFGKTFVEISDPLIE